MTRKSRRKCVAVALWVAAAASAPAACAQGGDWALAPRVSNAELARQRGGFNFGGLDIQLGAEISSYLGDQLVARTTLSWSTGGGSVNSFSAALTPATADTVRAGLLNGTGVMLSLGSDSVVLANGGQTAFIQRGTGTIQNIIVNTASNVRLNQTIDATLDITGYAPFLNGVLASRIGSTLTAMSELAVLSSRPN